MPNTYCKSCIFSKTNVELEDSCEFDILYHIKDIKNILIKDDSYYIENYKCKYAFSNQILVENNLDKNNVKEKLISESHIAYYLIINARHLSRIEDFIPIAEQINSIDIQPKLVSILIDINNTNNKTIFEILHKNIKKDIRWKLHAFLNDISFNEAANVAAETNIQTSDSALLYFWDSSISDFNTTNNRINHIFFVRNIQQNNIFGFKSSEFDGMCLPISLYKSIITLVDRDILIALSSITDFSLETYEQK
jgi:hypothetical protein